MDFVDQSCVLRCFCQTGDHDHPVGAPYLHVCDGNGVLLSLLRRLYVIPLPLSVQEEARPGKEGKIAHSAPSALFVAGTVKWARDGCTMSSSQTVTFCYLNQ